MSLFGKNHMTSAVDALELDNNTSSTTTKFGFNRGNSTKSKYGIDKAITLVRSLQKHNINSRVIAGIMKQTLESVGIHFTDIVSDAKRKESQINNEFIQKDRQFEEMTRKFEAMKQEKIKLQQELDETASVREFLQQAIKEERPVAAETKPTARPTNSQQQHTEKVDNQHAAAS